MNACVINNYVDRETGELHVAGERVELTAARAAELAAGGYVQCEAAPEPEPEMTAQQMRARIRELGGTFPVKATKARLAEILADIEQ